MSALKRIEEKYNGTDHVLSPRSDVVKLARALDAVSQGGHDDDCLFCARKDFNAERALKEVAGD